MLVVQTELTDSRSSQGAAPGGKLHIQPSASQTSQLNRLVLNTSTQKTLTLLHWRAIAGYVI